MAKARLRFYARGTALVADVIAQEHPTHPVRRFVGRRWQEILPGRWGWAPKEEAEEHDFHHDLVRACKEGDLWPADAETAKLCGVGFDPEFGGEETETIKAWKAKNAAPAASPSKKVEPKAEGKPSGKADV